MASNDNQEESVTQLLEDVAKITFQLAQYLIIFIGALVRYCGYKDIGRYNRNISRPKSLKLKLGLQGSILGLILLQTITYAVLDHRSGQHLDAHLKEA